MGVIPEPDILGPKMAWLRSKICNTCRYEKVPFSFFRENINLISEIILIWIIFKRISLKNTWQVKFFYEKVPFSFFRENIFRKNLIWIIYSKEVWNFGWTIRFGDVWRGELLDDSCCLSSDQRTSQRFRRGKLKGDVVKAGKLLNSALKFEK